MENILQAFGDFNEVLPKLDRLKTTFSKDHDFNQVVARIYSHILDFLHRVYKIFRRKAWRIWFPTDWGLFERRFD